MIEIFFQRIGNAFYPATTREAEAARNFKEYEPIRTKCYGIRKARSVPQLGWIHAILTITAKNTEDPQWNTLEKAKFQVKVAIRFIKHHVTIGNVVHTEPKSFAFELLTNIEEANRVFDAVKMECAEHLQCDPEELAARAKEESKLTVNR